MKQSIQSHFIIPGPVAQRSHYSKVSKRQISVQETKAHTCNHSLDLPNFHCKVYMLYSVNSFESASFTHKNNMSQDFIKTSTVCSQWMQVNMSILNPIRKHLVLGETRWLRISYDWNSSAYHLGPHQQCFCPQSDAFLGLQARYAFTDKLVYFCRSWPSSR